MKILINQYKRIFINKAPQSIKKTNIKKNKEIMIKNKIYRNILISIKI